jgi:hypothetical protein
VGPINENGVILIGLMNWWFIWVKVICMELFSPLYRRAYTSLDRLTHSSGLHGLIFPTLSAFYDTRSCSVPVGEVSGRASLQIEDTGEKLVRFSQARGRIGEDRSMIEVHNLPLHVTNPGIPDQPVPWKVAVSCHYVERGADAAS